MMPHFGKRSKHRLKGVNIVLVHILNKLVEIMDVTIIEGKRTQERQNELVAKGNLLEILQLLINLGYQ